MFHFSLFYTGWKDNVLLFHCFAQGGAIMSYFSLFYTGWDHNVLLFTVLHRMGS